MTVELIMNAIWLNQSVSESVKRQISNGVLYIYKKSILILYIQSLAVIQDLFLNVLNI